MSPVDIIIQFTENITRCLLKQKGKYSMYKGNNK